MDNKIIFSHSFDPWHNLALEEYLFDHQGEGATLYLWQNQNTVVIGRNQNAWRECRAELLEAEGGRLARRSSGGGAVFHDLGNLCFTFLMPRKDYDLLRQFSVIQAALAQFGVKAVVSGRNDLVLETGEKFSGNAFRFTQTTALQHGTLLVNADMEKLGRYLVPSKLKLEAKGISSVRSRVKNLGELTSGITVESLQQALTVAFAKEYGGADFIEEADCDTAAVAALTAKYGAWEWRFGEAPAFSASIHTRFDWGEIELGFTCENGIVKKSRVFTDAMDETLAEKLEEKLTGSAFRSDELAARAAAVGGAEAEELARYIRNSDAFNG